MTELTRRIDHRDHKRTTVGTLYTFIIHTSYIKCHTMYYIGRGAGLVIARNYLLSTNKLLNPSSRVRSYLIIVIFFTLTQFLELKFYTQMRVYKRHICIDYTHCTLNARSKMVNFHVQSGKIYTGQKNLH